VRPVEEPLVQPGDRLALAKDDYAGGRDMLRMRVTRVLTRDGTDLRHRSWVQLAGVVLIGASEGNERTVVVRVAALVANPPMRPETRG
jgi:hypothetical protein